MSDKPIILRRLKTKDGIVSNIEEIHEYRMSEERLIKKELSAFRVTEYETFESRTYQIKKHKTAILLEMEEV